MKPKDLNNFVILSEKDGDGKKIIAYIQSLNIDTGNYAGTASIESGNQAPYYGVINGRFDTFSLDIVERSTAEIMLVNSINKFVRGDIILVWSRSLLIDEREAKQRIFIQEIEGAKAPIVCIDGKIDDTNENISDFKIGKPFATTNWQHAKHIELSVFTPIKINLTSSYDTVIGLNSVKVGCQRIEFNKVKEVYQAVLVVEEWKKKNKIN